MKAKLIMIGALLVATCAPALADTTSAHHDMVMSHGAQVMPFDMKVAMHMFTPNSAGGTLEIMVQNMDPKQIALVRQHLRFEAAKFVLGDYSDPAYIHGKTMPGLSGMEADLVAVRYADTAMGGKITFVATDPAAIEAIHEWLAAQSADHAAPMHT